MKKIAFLCILTSCFALVACQDSATQQAQAAPAPAEATPIAAATPTPEPTPKPPPDEGDLFAGQVIEGEGGLRIEIEEPGSGPLVKAGNSVTMRYVARLDDGTEIDSSTVTIEEIGSGVIEGLSRALVHLREESKATITIPPEIGFDRYNRPKNVPEGATVVFDLEVIELSAKED